MVFVYSIYLNVGGRYSGGNTGGSGNPDIAISMRCMAKINSSAVSFPSWSISDRLLEEKKVEQIPVEALVSLKCVSCFDKD